MKTKSPPSSSWRQVSTTNVSDLPVMFWTFLMVDGLVNRATPSSPPRMRSYLLTTRYSLLLSVGM